MEVEYLWEGCEDDVTFARQFRRQSALKLLEVGFHYSRQITNIFTFRLPKIFQSISVSKLVSK